MTDESSRPIFEVINLPRHKCKLILTDGIEFYFTYDIPNIWWRFWHKLFFGFKWEKVE